MSKLKIYVNEIPACKNCPFNVVNIMKELQGKEYCLLKSQLASGQYSGVNIIDYKKFSCPLKKVNEHLFIELNGEKIYVQCEK